MDRIVGMTVVHGLDEAAAARASGAERRALDELPWLASGEVEIGATRVRFWGHGDPGRLVHRLAGGRLAIVAGQPVPAPDAAALAGLGDRVPWEGRLLILRVSADGSEWEAFNDWSGSLQAFHAPAGAGRILSTLEPVVVAAAGLDPGDVSRAGVVSLLTHGYFLGDRTLYETMRALGADTVTRWTAAGVAVSPQRSLIASEERWQVGWEDLAEGLHERTVGALRRGLRTEPEWRLPLSGGMDSRLIAAVAVDEGIPVETLTYGDEDWLDVRYAREVARMLDLPWRHVPLGVDYLARRSPTWGALFGTSMHFHGMYQYPLLETFGPGGTPIVTGYTGDPMGGAQTAAMLAGTRSVRRRFADKWHMWEEDELGELLRFDPADALAELDAELDAQIDALDGPLFQRLWIVFQHNHVARFSSYQPTMYDLWSGVGVPFVDRELANYTLSLPRAALDDRRLQLHAFRRAYPALATIPGTWSAEPIAPSGRFYLKRTLADVLPERFHRGPLAEFAPTENVIDQRALAETGDAALWPLAEARSALEEWVDPAMIDRVRGSALGGDLGAMARLETIQALAWALLP